MISDGKAYGQYVLRPATDLYQPYLRDDDSSSSSKPPMYASCCSLPTRWTSLELVSKTFHTYDTSIFRFALPTGTKRLCLPLGSHLLIRAPDAEHEGRGDAIRPYTSISDDSLLENEGFFDILVKRYDEWGVKNTSFLYIQTNHTFRPPGAVSNYIHNLKIGDRLDFKHADTCLGRFIYPLPSDVQTMTMIAVGVGVAPMISILRTLLRDTKVAIVLLYGAREVHDLLMRETLQDWAREYSHNCRDYRQQSREVAGWAASSSCRA